jgi:hypothetical protein
VAEPPKQGIALKHRLLPGHEVTRELDRIGKELGAGGEGFFRVQPFDHAGRIAGGHTVGGDRIHHNGPGPYDTVFTDGYALADDGTVSDPGIFFDDHRTGVAERDAVVDAVPVRIGNVSPVGNHAVIADGDADRTADADTRADQAVVTDGDMSFARLVRPHRQPDFLVRGGDDRGKPSDGYGCAEQLHMPWPHECESSSQMFQLGTKKVAGIKFLKLQVGFLDDVGAVIFNHDGSVVSPIAALPFITHNRSDPHSE